MANPKPSFALKHPFFLEAEKVRSRFKFKYGSEDVYWVRLALRERKLHEGAKVSEEDIAAFQWELGEAIFNGGVRSGKRFEDARKCIRKGYSNATQDELGIYAAYFKCCDDLQRLPTLPEVRRLFYDHKLKPRTESEYRREHGRNPTEWELPRLLDENWKIRNLETKGEVGVAEPGDFRKKCQSLGLLLSDGNHLSMVRRLCGELRTSDEGSIDVYRLLEKVSGEPKLQQYLLPNWSIDMFFWWWEWASEKSASLSEREHAALTYLFDAWNGFVQQWMKRLTRDGAVKPRADSSLGHKFWKLADEKSRPPSVPEILLEMSKDDLMSVLQDCWCAEEALEFLVLFKEELEGQCDKRKGTENVKVSHLGSLLKVVQPFQELHAFQWSMARMA